MEINGQAPSTPTHILSVDVEDYFMVEAFAGLVQRSTSGHSAFAGGGEYTASPRPI